MRWLIDECVDAQLVIVLRQIGHDVVYLSEGELRLPDIDVMALAFDENRLLLTEDKDFGDLIFKQRGRVPGLLLLRIDVTRRALKAARLLAAIEQFGERLFGYYTVVEDARFRSRLLHSL